MNGQTELGQRTLTVGKKGKAKDMHLEKSHIECGNCEQAFCQTCAARGLLRINMCPRCLKPGPDLTKVHRNVAKLLQQVQVKCRYESCQQIVPYDELQMHELSCSECDQCLRNCGKCGVMVPKAALQNH